MDLGVGSLARVGFRVAQFYEGCMLMFGGEAEGLCCLRGAGGGGGPWKQVKNHGMVIGLLGIHVVI